MLFKLLQKLLNLIQSWLFDTKEKTIKTKQKKVCFSKGQIDGRLLERQDLAILDKSGREITNLVSTPYGGIKTREGLLTIPVDVFSALDYTLTTAVGGVVADVENGGYLETDGLGSISADTSILKFDLGSTKTVSSFDYQCYFNGIGSWGGFSAELVLTGGVITDVVFTGVPALKNIFDIEIVVIAPITGSGADLQPIFNDSGQLSGITIVDGGSGYDASASIYIPEASASKTTSSIGIETSTDDVTYTPIETKDIVNSSPNVGASGVAKQIIDINADIRYIRIVSSSCDGCYYFGNVSVFSTDVTSFRIEPFMYNEEYKYLCVMADQGVSIYDGVTAVNISASGLLDKYISALNVTQKENKMIITHPDMRTKIIERVQHDSDTFVAATTDYLTLASTMAREGQVVQLTTTGVLPTGLSATTDYYIVDRDGSSFKLSLTQGGEAVDITSAGTGTHTATWQGTGYGVSWTFGDYAWFNIPKDAFNNEVTTAIAQTLDVGATEGSVKLTIGASTWAAVGGTVGQIVDGGGGRVRITGIDPVDAKIAFGYTIIPFYTTDQIASGDWVIVSGYEDVWSASRGYPSTCVFYQQRLWFGGSKSKPSTIWGSRLGFIDDFENVANYDNDAINQTISSKQADEIVNMYANRGLQVFTAGAEWSVPEGATTPNTFTIIKNTSNGSYKGVSPTDISGVTLFIEKSGKSLLSYVYTEGQNAYTTSNISLLSNLIDNPVDMDMLYSSTRNESNYLYIVNGDGSMVVSCIDLEQQINSYVKFETDGQFKGVCVLGDDVYVVVSRDVGYTLERFADIKTDCTFLETPQFSHSAFTGWTINTGYEMVSTPFSSTRTASSIYNEMVAAGYSINTLQNLAGTTYPGTDFDVIPGTGLVVYGAATYANAFIPTGILDDKINYSFSSGSATFSRWVGEPITYREFALEINGTGSNLTRIYRLTNGVWEHYNVTTDTGLSGDTLIDPNQGYWLNFTSSVDWNDKDDSNEDTVRVPNELIGRDICIYDDNVIYKHVEEADEYETLDVEPPGDVYLGMPFDYLLNGSRLSINSQTENIDKRISKATVVTRDTAKLNFCGQEMEKTDDLYDYYSLTAFERDPYYTVTGSSYDTIEILSILLNINYGEK